MYINSKKIATKYLQNPNKFFVCNRTLNLNPVLNKKDSSDFNELVMIKYQDLRKLEDMKYYQNSDKKNLVSNSQFNNQVSLVSENIQEVQNWIRYDKIVNKDLNLQAACNTLYLMSQYNLQDQKAEEKIYEVLKTKGIENLNLSNLLDIKTFLKTSQNSKIFELHSDVESLLQQKLKLYQNIHFVQENGNSVADYEEATGRSFWDNVLIFLQNRLGFNVASTLNENILMHESEMRRVKQSQDDLQVAQPTQLVEQKEEEHSLELKSDKGTQTSENDQKVNTKETENKSKNQINKQNNK